jgi:tetratricopeptide (TPR) repeat protein
MSLRISTAGRPSLLVLAILVLPAGVSAQAGRAQVEEGNRLYRDGLFEEAHQKYLEALAAAPESPVIPFNDGNALYQSADYERAMQAYERAIETGDPALQSAAWYNLGNALYRQQQLEPALEAYKQALRLGPADVDAKHNLERVLEQMQQQQQQQQQDGEDDEQEDDSQDEQSQDQQQRQDQQQQPQQQDPGEDQQDQQQGEDEGDDPPEQQPQDNEGEQPPEGQQGQSQQPPGEMTPEEAERLLDAIDEDPEDVNRKPAQARGRRPRKPW